jgi:hypothetical protein
MTGRQRELLQWFGLLGGAAAWSAHLVLGFEVTEASCDRGLGPFDASTALVILTVAAGVVILLAESASIAVYRKLEPVDKDAPGPDGRRRFLAAGAIVGNVLLFVAVVLAGAATLSQSGCRGA